MMIDPGGALHPHPFAAAVIPHLQAVDPARGEDREQVDVLVPEQAAGARIVLRRAHRRIIVQPQAEIGPGELAVIDVRVAAEPLEHRLRDRLEQRLMGQDQPAELRLVVRARPKILRDGTAPRAAAGCRTRAGTRPSPRPGRDGFRSSPRSGNSPG